MNYILDMSVISELVAIQPDPSVIGWIENVGPEDVYGVPRKAQKGEKMKRFLLLVLISISLLGTTTALAGTSYPWRDHAAPFDFLFENHFDTHQQGTLTGQGKYKGFFYVKFTGDLTEDGVPIATHGNCSEIQDDCTVGWLLKGIPMQAKYLGHEMGQHPTWCVEAVDLPKEPGYSHFHWLNESSHADGLTVGEVYEGYLLKLNAIETFFFDHHGGFLVSI